MKKLDNLLEKTGIKVLKNYTQHVGRFTIVELTDNLGHSVVGVARKSDTDLDSPELGKSIARGRAERALYNKLKHRKIQHIFMG